MIMNMTIPSQEPLKLNLQFFAEGEEVVTESVDPVEQSEVDTSIENVEETEQTEQTTNPFSFELQYNKENVVIDSEEKLRELAQKGMNYDKIQDKYNQTQNDPLSQWASKYMKSVGYDDPNKFIEAVTKENEQQSFNKSVQEYVDKGYGQDVANELATLKKQNEETNKKFEILNKQDEETKNNQDFLDWYDGKVQKGVFNEPFDVKNIPAEVWESVDRGIPLKEAFIDYKLDNMRVNTEQQVINNIKKNGSTSTGSLQDNATTDDTPLTKEVIERMAKDPTWLEANFDKIEKSGYFKQF